MTKAEAMERFGIKETDTICKDGVRELLKRAEAMLKIWSRSSYERAKIEKEIEAYNALLKD